MTRQAIRELLAIQLKATAALQLQMAAALIGKGQDELRAHFMQSAELMMKAVKELAPTNEQGNRNGRD